MKAKLTVTIVSILSVLVLVGVGFAGWVIINPDVKADSDGDFTVYGVEDKSYNLTAEILNGTIIFGKSQNGTDKWLTTDGVENESLTAIITLTIDKIENAKGKTYTLTMNIENDDSYVSKTNKTYTELATANYVVYPTVFYTVEGLREQKTTLEYSSNAYTKNTLTINSEDFKPTSGSTGSATLTIKVTFGWGSEFDYRNPYEYYNEKDYSTENIGSAINALEAINNLSAKYTISVVENKAE